MGRLVLAPKKYILVKNDRSGWNLKRCWAVQLLVVVVHDPEQGQRKKKTREIERVSGRDPTTMMGAFNNFPLSFRRLTTPRAFDLARFCSPREPQQERPQLLLRLFIMLQPRRKFFSSLVSAVRHGKETRSYSKKTTAEVSDYDAYWEDNYAKLKEYSNQYYLGLQRENGRELRTKKGRQEEIITSQTLPFPPKNETRLRGFINKSRRLYRLATESSRSSKSLSPDRIQKLKDLGLQLAPRKDFWEHRFQELIRFHDKHKAFPYDLPFEELNHDERKLFYWCQKQKKAYSQLMHQKQIENEEAKQHHLLVDHRLERLEQIGFTWNCKDETWMSFYRELEDYQRVHGNCLVPVQYPLNRKFAKWIGGQRHSYKLLKENKPSPMTPQRIQLLEKLGFEWNAQDVMWKTKFYELQEHFRLNGRGNTKGLKGPLLRWVRYQKQLYRDLQDGKRSSLSPERQELLESIGFFFE